MDKKLIRGILTIPSTPFHEDGTIDLEGFKRVVEFCIHCGAHGLVYPVNASEHTTLSDDERYTLTRALVEVTDGRIPTIVGVAAPCMENAARHAAFAREVGASAVIAMPPYVKTKEFTPETIFRYYQGISDAARLPVFIQNYVPPIGTNLSCEFIHKLFCDIEYVQYLKEETVPSTLKLTELIEMSESYRGIVFGGSGCRYLIEEYKRGTAGNMPGCHVTDVCVALWNALENGNDAQAMQIYRDMAPLFFFEAQFPGAYKEVLKLRGVIGCTYTRNSSYTLDAIGAAYLRECLDMLRPYMTV